MPVIVFLALLWAAVLIPVGVKMVAERRAYYASNFGDGLNALDQAEGSFSASDDARNAGEPPGPLSTVDAALLRSVLAGFLIAVVLSGSAALLSQSRAALAVNLALDDCLLAFVALLVIRRDAHTLANRHSPELALGGAPDDRFEAPVPRRVYTDGVPVISAPIAGALGHSVASTA